MALAIDADESRRAVDALHFISRRLCATVTGPALPKTPHVARRAGDALRLLTGRWREPELISRPRPIGAGGAAQAVEAVRTGAVLRTHTTASGVGRPVRLAARFARHAHRPL